MPNSKKKPVQDWIEENPSKTQFYVTLAVLITTIILAFLSLRETRKQYGLAKGQLDNANEQLKLARQQFKFATDQRTSDLQYSTKKDSLQKINQLYDSIRNSKNDIQQKKNNDYQNDINKQQLIAIQTQANVAEAQFQFQKIQSANQFEDNRPVFVIDSIKFNKSKSTYKPTISFHVTNHGIRNPHVDSSVLAVWNLNNKCSEVEKHITNIDLRDVSFTTGIACYQDCIDDPDTIYYLNIIYEDTYDSKIKTKHRFFRYKINKDKSVTTVDVSDIETVGFIRYLKLSEKIWGRLL